MEEPAAPRPGGGGDTGGVTVVGPGRPRGPGQLPLTLGALAVGAWAAASLVLLGAREPWWRPAAAFVWGSVKGLAKTALFVAVGALVVIGLVALGAPVWVLVAFGAGLLAVGGWFLHSQRRHEQVAAGHEPRFWPTLGVTVLDLLGVAGIIEGVTGRRMLTGARLPPEAAGELFGLGLGQVLTLGLGSRFVPRGRMPSAVTAEVAATRGGAATVARPARVPSLGKALSLGRTHLERQALQNLLSRFMAANPSRESQAILAGLLRNPESVARLARLRPGEGSSLQRAALVLHGYVDMELKGVAVYAPEMLQMLKSSGIVSAADRAALRAAAEAGCLTETQLGGLEALGPYIKSRLSTLGAREEVIAVLDNYGPRADILRLAALDRIAASEAAGHPGVAARFAKDIDQILARHGVASPGDRAAMKALPPEELPGPHRAALQEIRQYWQDSLETWLQTHKWVEMQREVAESRVRGMLDSSSRYNEAWIDEGQYFTWHEAVSDLSGPALAYDQMALWYAETPFSPAAGNRYYVVAPMDIEAAGQFGVPLSEPLGPGSRLPPGPFHPAYPSQPTGHTAARYGFPPEWTWAGDRVPYPDGTRLVRETPDGVSKILARVDRGRWVKDPQVNLP